MWYLVVPPIIVVLSLFFLLWYLSRKGEDPVVAQKVLETSAERSGFRLKMKEFFLRQIEKMAQRFKVNLLKAHNALNEFTQSVKNTRTKMRPTPSVSREALTPPVSEEKRSFSFKKPLPETVEPVREVSGDDLLNTAIVRKSRRNEEFSPAPEKKELSERPMVSEAVTHPETRRRSLSQDASREESLIARIAKDPKDFTAYEELGDYYLETGNIKDAKECYRQVLKLSPVHRMVKIKIRRLEKLLTRGGE
jgi:tetratricopeptide (TPR) repeat protein